MRKILPFTLSICFLLLGSQAMAQDRPAYEQRDQPVTKEDLQILERADEILSDEAKWLQVKYELHFLSCILSDQFSHSLAWRSAPNPLPANMLNEEEVMSRPPYYLGFTTLASETSVEELPVRGAVPAWLTGTLVRNGPAKFEVGDKKYNHWFDGLAMLHKFAFAAGRVSYANRYLRSRAYEGAMAQGKISQREFATDPCRSLFRRVASWFSPKFDTVGEFIWRL